MKNRPPQTDHHEPKREEIAALAHQIWEREGRPKDRSMEHWIQARIQLRITKLAQLKIVAGSENKQRTRYELPAMAHSSKVGIPV